MRTFKRLLSVRNLSQTILFLAAHPDQPCLAALLAAKSEMSFQAATHIFIQSDFLHQLWHDH